MYWLILWYYVLPLRQMSKPMTSCSRRPLCFKICHEALLSTRFSLVQHGCASGERYLTDPSWILFSVKLAEYRRCVLLKFWPCFDFSPTKHVVRLPVTSNIWVCTPIPLPSPWSTGVAI